MVFWSEIQPDQRKDLACMAHENKRREMFVVVDYSTCQVFIQQTKSPHGQGVHSFLLLLDQEFPGSSAFGRSWANFSLISFSRYGNGSS